jgi:uncharacterized protein
MTGNQSFPPPPPLPPSYQPQQPRPGAASAFSNLPPEFQSANATSEDRNTAMIAFILGAVTGFIAPLILYLVKKDNMSPFLKYHLLQNIWFQVALIVAYFVLIIVAVVLMALTAGIAGCVCMPIIFVGAIGELVYSIYGGIQVNNGKDFDYWLVGSWVRKSL